MNSEGTTKSSQVTQKPKNLLHLFWLIIKGFFKNIPKIFKRQLVKIIVIFIAVIIVNTYLVVVKNEGFSPTSGNKLLPITALSGAMKSATIFWAFAAFFISNVIGRIRKDGIKVFFVEVFASPKFMIDNFKNSSKGLVYFLVTAALIMPVTLIIKNRYLLLLYFLMAFFSYTSREKGFLLYVFKLGSDDIKKMLKGEGNTSPDSLYLMVLGLTFAFMISYVLFPIKPYGVIVLSIVFLALAILYGKKKITAKTVGASMIFAAFNILYFRFTGSVFADDGGWQEAGGTFGKWVKSPGAGKAVSMGFVPGLGSVAGTFLGGLPYSIGLSDILENIGLDDGTNTPSNIDTGADIADQGVETTDNTVKPGEITTPKNENLLNWSKDLVKNILGTKQGMGMLDDMIKSTSLGNFSDDAVNAFTDFMQNNMGVDELGDIVFQGDQAKRLDLINDMINSSKANQIMSGVNKGLFWGGAFVDTMMNYGLGDGAVLAGTKGLSNAYLMDYLGSKNPGLGVMELGNFVLFGGSQASDCISPAKTITGTVNFGYDLLFKDPSKWQDRLSSGVYGPNVKNFAEGAGIIGDAVKDPGQFWSEFSDAVQVNDTDSDIWTDMYDSSFELWNLPDNVNTDLSISHPIDGIRTVGCAIGKQVTDGVVAIGEGTARISQYLGDVVGSNQILDNAATAVGDAASAVYDTASDAVNATVDTVSDMAEGAYDTVNDMTGGAVDKAADMASDAAEAVGDAASKVGEAVGDAANAVKDAAGSAIDSVNSAVDSTVNAVENAGSKVVNYIGSWFE